MYWSEQGRVFAGSQTPFKALRFARRFACRQSLVLRSRRLFSAEKVRSALGEDSQIV